MTTKERLSASVDADLIAAAEQAVSRGEAPNVSAWVNAALRFKIENDRRLRALDEFISAYENAHGEISSEEMRDAVRRAGGRALAARGQRRTVPAKNGRRR